MGRTTTRFLAATLFGCGCLFTAACGSSFPDQLDVTMSGTYTLRTVNGNGLPFAEPDGSFLSKAEIDAQDDGTWTETLTYSTSQSGATTSKTVQDNGTWSLNSTTLTLNSKVSNSTAYKGVFNTHILTLTGPDGNLYSFIE